MTCGASEWLAEPGYFDDRGHWVSPTLRALRELEKAAAADDWDERAATELKAVAA